MRTIIVMEDIIPYVSIPLLLFSLALCSFSSLLHYTFDVFVIPCCMNSIISTALMSQKTVVISIVPGGPVCLNSFLDLLGESTTLNVLWFHHLLLLRCEREIKCHLCGIAVKIQSRNHSLPFVRTCGAFSEPLVIA
jgi:hypothetical protein